jgi:hypothetical protein
MVQLTTPAMERAVARLLGAPAAVASSAVAALEREQALGHGVLLLAVMGAARWGTDAPGALARLAGGAAIPAAWSDYEVRVAVAEAADERDDALRRVRVDPDRAAEAADLDEAVGALLAGAGAIHVTAALDRPEDGFLRDLCDRVGAILDAPEPAARASGVRVSDTWLDLVGEGGKFF